MMKTGFKMVLAGLLLVAVAVVAGCGGGGSGSSSSGSLALAIDKTSVESGGIVVATVTLTASTGQPVNDVPIRVMSTNSNVVASASGKTNMSGVAQVTLSAKWLAADQSVYLSAGSDVTANSPSVALTVVAPKLTATMPGATSYAATGASPGSVVRVVQSGNTVKFLNGASNPIVNQPIDVTITSITNQRSGDAVIFYPSPGVTIVSPTGILSAVTDNTGTANVPMAVDVVVPATGSQHVITLNWQATTDYAGNTYTLTGSSQFTVTN